MTGKKKKSFTQLDAEQRFIIRDRLRQCVPLSHIAAEIGVAASTVTREVKRNRTKVYPKSKTVAAPECVRALECEDGCTGRSCPSYHYLPCSLTEKSPYVCDACPSRYSCKKVKYYYVPRNAQAQAEDNNLYRVPLKFSATEMATLDDLTCERVKGKGQSPYHLFATNEPNIPISLSTYYRYINDGYLKTKRIHMPMAPRYAQRKVPRTSRVKADKEYLIGRTFDDFSEALNNGEFDEVVEMDTVLGLITDKPAILTFCFRNSGLFLCYRLEAKTITAVRRKLLDLQKSLGEELFVKLFGVILTDRGSEFQAPEILEKNMAHEKIISLYYCDAYSSGQKGKLERTHHFLRRFIPKKRSISAVHQAQLNKIRDNINALNRRALDGMSAYQLFVQQYGQDVADALGLNKIPAELVTLK